jgi:hypothetical protein
MAKANGPLFSLEASGTIGKAITYGKNKGRNFVRVRVTPANPQTDAQTGVRANFAGLVLLWKANTIALTSAFKVLADQTQISAFNAFVGFNQKRLSQNKGPANSTTPTEVAPTSNATALAATVSGKYVSLTWTQSLDANAWESAIYRKLGTTPTGLRTELIAIVPRGTSAHLDGPLVAGSWQYVIQAQSSNGGKFAVSAPVTAVVA